MDDWRLSSMTALAYLAALVALADSGPGNAKVVLYIGDRPAVLGDHTAPVQAEIVLAKPCGTVTVDGLQLHPLDLAGAMVMATGVSLFGEWYTADGRLIADASVSDSDHAGALRISGGVTPPGGTSPLLIAGGLVALGETFLT